MEIKVTMPLTKTELLIPRVLCIGGKEGEPNYPGSQFNTGDIVPLFLTDAKGEKYCWLRKEVFLYESDLDKFPNCFRPLPWWYGRTVEEMPEYVTVNLLGSLQWMANEIKTGVVYKLNVDFNYNYYEGVYLGIQYKNGGGTLGEYLQPADEADYQEYQKQKQ